MTEHLRVSDVSPPAPARAPRRVQTRLGWGLALLLAGACAARGEPRAEPRPPEGMPERPSGCIDTPYIGGDQRATTTGTRCGRKASKDPVLLRGRVGTQDERGLPGPALEGAWVTIHPLEGGPLRLEALPPARAESRTGPQGSFSISLFGAGEYVLAVRLERSGPMLAARRIQAQAADRTPELSLLVPLDPRIQAHLEAQAAQSSPSP